MATKKILLIDDSAFFRGQLKIALNREYEVIEAASGAEGLEMVKRERPDLVLLDVVMPDYSGFDICRILRNSDRGGLLPIILITTQDDQKDVIYGFEVGADDYVKKPFDSRELLGRVRNLFRRIDRNRNANPLTGLSGYSEAVLELSNRIRKNEVFAVICVDIDNFKAYNEVYGFVNGDRILILLADILVDQTALCGNPGDIALHIGGDDFMVITTPEHAAAICEAVIADFDRKVPGFYNDDDRAKGFLVRNNRSGGTDTFPIMTISMAVVTNEKRVISNPAVVMDIAGEVGNKLKTMAGSNWFADRRRD